MDWQWNLHDILWVPRSCSIGFEQLVTFDFGNRHPRPNVSPLFRISNQKQRAMFESWATQKSNTSGYKTRDNERKLICERGIETQESITPPNSKKDVVTELRLGEVQGRQPNCSNHSEQ